MPPAPKDNDIHRQPIHASMRLPSPRSPRYLKLKDRRERGAERARPEGTRRSARVALAFGMRVTAYRQNLTGERAAEHGATPLPRDGRLVGADVVSIHLVLSERPSLQMDGNVPTRWQGATRPPSGLLRCRRTRRRGAAVWPRSADVRSVAGAPPEGLRRATHNGLRRAHSRRHATRGTGT
ncbi:uncharacterized protein SOCEGT47_006310 [Sorangium cellulosum]|uniref:Uncharacterized protein n=1 Tax=Sorangium cellulosum TaxID=56 RepID=A0A4P2PU21_SORCE|nr:uncharacterized protein SOCEGT47_006310 [Sorangium cellulosum]